MSLLRIFRLLYTKYGSQGWWPICHSRGSGNPAKAVCDTLFEICVGAILTQNTAWTNVEKALRCLLKANLMSPKAIAACPVAKLQKCIRSSGYYKQKTKKLKLFSRWLLKECNGDISQLKKYDTQILRQKLLTQWGIGEETADSILLYALQKPIFVIDAYTRRLLKKYKIEFKTYVDYQKFCEKNLQLPNRRSRLSCHSDRAKESYLNKTKLFQEFHALIVRWGKDNQ